MSETRRDRVSCHVCGAESEHTVTLRATDEGPPDLDTRPAETLRSTMSTWVQRCPSCGYCAPDLEAGPPRAARVVQTTAYKALVDEPARPALANAFLASSAVFEAGAAFADAGWQAVYAAWACDDVGDDEAAVQCRMRAVELFSQAALVRQEVVAEPGGADAVMADLLRRAGRFDEAIARAEAGAEQARAPLTRRVLAYIASLAAQEDRAAHPVDDAPPVLAS